MRLRDWYVVYDASGQFDYETGLIVGIGPKNPINMVLNEKYDKTNKMYKSDL